MAEVLIFIAFVSGVIGLCVFVAIWTAKVSQKTRQNFVALAERLGLEATPVAPRFGGYIPQGEASGLLHGRPARLFGYTTGSGKHRVTWAALGVRPRATGGLELSLEPQNVGTKVAEWFGAREIKVGDPAFDDTWFIRTNQPDFLTAALLPELRQRLTAAFPPSTHARRISFKLKADTLTYAEAGEFGSDERCARFVHIAEVLRDLADVAEVFAQAKS